MELRKEDNVDLKDWVEIVGKAIVTVIVAVLLSFLIAWAVWALFLS